MTVCDQAHEELDPDPSWLTGPVPDPVAVGTAASSTPPPPSWSSIDALAGGAVTPTTSQDDRPCGAVRRRAHEVESGTGALRLDLTRRLAAEALGTGLLVMAVVGSGIAASRLSSGDVGLQLLENAAATAAALIGLILMFGAVSGAHFNPVVSLLDRLLGTTTTRDTGLYVVAQVIGGCLGAMLANLMFDLPRSVPPTTARPRPSGCPSSWPRSPCCCSSKAACARAAPR